MYIYVHFYTRIELLYGIWNSRSIYEIENFQ